MSDVPGFWEDGLTIHHADSSTIDAGFHTRYSSCPNGNLIIGLFILISCTTKIEHSSEHYTARQTPAFKISRQTAPSKKSSTNFSCQFPHHNQTTKFTLVPVLGMRTPGK
jgi:hypothetical protein